MKKKENIRGASGGRRLLKGAAVAVALQLAPVTPGAETSGAGEGEIDAASHHTVLEFYGRLSVNTYYLDPANQASALVMDDKSLNSRLGVQLEQGLDHGLIGFGKIEYNILPTSSEAIGQMRDTHIGLRSDFGELAVGNFNGAYKTTGGVAWDPFVTTPLEARRQAAMGGGAYAQNGFMRRMVQYRTPRIAGLAATVQVGADDRSSEAEHARQRDGQGDAGDVNLGAQYAVSHWTFVGSYVRADRAPSGQNRNWKVGARWNDRTWDIAYQFEDVRIRDRIDFDGLENVSDGVIVNNRSLGDDTRHHYFRTSYRTGPSQVHGVFGYMRAAEEDADIAVYTAGYTHWFSDTFRGLGGVQFQDRGAAYESGDLMIFSVGFRYDFAADLYRNR
jgi:predicted porin